MDNINTIRVGSNIETPYVAFGDDSQFENVVVYGFVICKRRHLKHINTEVKLLKKRFKIPNDVVLHCKMLFHADKRKKIGLEHLTPEDVQSIVSRAITIINQGPAMLNYAVGNLDVFRSTLGDSEPVLEFQNISDGSITEVPVSFDPKGALGILMQACFAVPPDGSQGPTANQCQIFASADSTRIKFIDSQKRRADGWYSGFSDIGSPDGQIFQMQPTIATVDTQPMLQLADVAAYVCSHAQDDSANRSFFREQLARIKYWSRKTYAA